MQLVVNVTYAVPIGIGLGSSAFPTHPYGPAGAGPAFRTLYWPDHSVDLPIGAGAGRRSGWTMVLWTAVLFIVLELVSNNVVEPWLYGSRTGLSPLAIIVAAIFWTWLGVRSGSSCRHRSRSA